MANIPKLELFRAEFNRKLLSRDLNARMHVMRFANIAAITKTHFVEAFRTTHVH